MLQADEPDTFVLATNRTETVRDFVTMAFKAADMPLEWRGSGEQLSLSRFLGRLRYPPR